MKTNKRASFMAWVAFGALWVLGLAISDLIKAAGHDFSGPWAVLYGGLWMLLCYRARELVLDLLTPHGTNVAAHRTPGPWRAVVAEVGGQSSFAVAPVNPSADRPNLVIALTGRVMAADEDESIANSLLIAQAPQMLALLKDWREACGAMVHDELASLTDEVIAKTETPE